MISLAFDPKIDIGHSLTFVTLTAGFFWWLYTSVRAWREKSNDDARSGALRLLLKLLRDSGGQAMNIEELHRQFHSQEIKELRKAYCGCNYRFKSMPLFEAAIYRLDWEGKIDFPSSNEVVFRVDRHAAESHRFHPTPKDKEHMLEILSGLLNKSDLKSWEIEAVAESCMLVAPEETSDMLRKALNISDPNVAQSVLSAMRRLLPDRT